MTNGQKNLERYPYKDLANELRGLRGRITQEAFANQLGIALRTYHRYEKGERKVPKGLLKLAHLLKEKDVGIVADVSYGSSKSNPISDEEYELIKAVRELDPISRKGVYLSAITQLNEAMRERNIRKDKGKKEILDKTIKVLTKAIAEV